MVTLQQLRGRSALMAQGPGERGHEGGASGSCRWGGAWPGALAAQEE